MDSLFFMTLPRSVLVVMNEFSRRVPPPNRNNSAAMDNGSADLHKHKGILNVSHKNFGDVQGALRVHSNLGLVCRHRPPKTTWRDGYTWLPVCRTCFSHLNSETGGTGIGRNPPARLRFMVWAKGLMILQDLNKTSRINIANFLSS